MSTLLLFAMVGAVGLVWGLIAINVWPSADAKHEGRPLRFMLWGMTLTAVVARVVDSQGMKGPAESLLAAAGFAFPFVLLAGLIGAWQIRGRASYPFVPGALLAFSSVIAASALLNGQIGQVTWAIALGLLYLPGLTVAIWRTSLTREDLRQTVRRIGLTVVWLSLAYAAADLPHALGDLPRRILLPGIAFRFAGVTPHPNGLAFVAALAIFLTIRARPKFWLLHIAACVWVIILAEARTLAVGMAVAALFYWIVSARKSRVVRAISSAVFGAPVAVLLWPTIISSFEETSLGADVTTFNSRTLVWNLVRDHWTEHPVLGWGAFTFDNRTGSPLSSLFFNNAHNQFLEALIEGGVIGLILMACVALVFAWSVFTTRDAPYVAVVVMTLFFMMTEVPLTLHNYGFNFSVVLGALLLAVLIPGPTPHTKPESHGAVWQDAHMLRIERALNSRAGAGGQRED